MKSYVIVFRAGSSLNRPAESHKWPRWPFGWFKLIVDDKIVARFRKAHISGYSVDKLPAPEPEHDQVNGDTNGG